MSSFESHRPVLEYALNKQGRSVLEVGGGGCSTPLIINKSIKSVTYENSQDYYSQISHLGSPNHDVVYEVDLVGKISRLVTGAVPYAFSLAFIDSNLWLDRCKIVSMLCGHAEVILLHDSFPEHLHRCIEGNALIPQFVYSLNLYPRLPPVPEYPPTLILSDVVDVTKWEVPGLTRG